MVDFGLPRHCINCCCSYGSQ